MTTGMRIRTIVAVLTLTVSVTACEQLGDAVDRIGELQQTLFAFQDRGIEGIGDIRVRGTIAEIEVTESLAQLDEIYAVESHRAVVTLLETFPAAADLEEIRAVLVSGTAVGPISVTSSEEGDVWGRSELDFLRSGTLPSDASTLPVEMPPISFRFDDSLAGCEHVAALDWVETPEGRVGTGWVNRTCESPEAGGIPLVYEVRAARGAVSDDAFSVVMELLPGDDPVESLSCDGWGRCVCLFSGTISAGGEVVCRVPSGTIRGAYSMNDDRVNAP